MNIAVYCSSSNQIAESYKAPAYQLGAWIAQNSHTLVFGGATGGLMTSVSEGAACNKGKITGVIPQAVIAMRRQSTVCTELIVVDSMNERKAIMKNVADVFVILPGSYGTLDELFDVIASGVVGEHKKPVIIVNQEGFYNDLIQLSLKMKDKKFIPVENYAPVWVNDIDECIAALSNFSSK
jgi:uncharacterized protein (TIGR00730 family)